ncbi:MAG: nucleoside recognition protein [Oscillospiraceae bacterium]|nr:nucleoside recognition protein [Oscillospiraceae bacterium]
MLNIIWPLFIVASFIYAIITGKVEEINNSIFDSTADAVTLTLTLIGTMCLWTGLMKIATETSIMKKLTKMLSPLMRILFPDIKKGDPVHEEISMNMVANVMGMGNAATPAGLKAMKSMQRTNKDKKVLSNSMAMFIVLNTASIQIIPTTVIAIRSSLRFGKSNGNDSACLDSDDICSSGRDCKCQDSNEENVKKEMCENSEEL